MDPKIAIMLRWAAILPTAIGAYCLAVVITLFCDFLDGKGWNSVADVWVVAMCAPAMSVLAAAGVAPRKYRLPIALSIAAFHAVVIIPVCICFYEGIFPDRYHLFTSFWRDVLVIVIAIASSIVGCLETAAPRLLVFRRKSRKAGKPA